MTETEAPLIEETVDIAAPPSRVWDLVTDLPRMAQWSPQVVRSFLRGGRPVRLGTRTVNVNRRGLVVWPTQAKVVRFEPMTEIAFRIKENKSIWSFTLAPTEAGGTRVVQQRTVPDGTSELSRTFVKRLFGGQDSFTAELALGMRQTLDRIKVEAEK